MKEGAIVIPGFNKSIPADVVAKAKELIEGIKDGSVYPFTGPLKDNKGELKVPAGTKLTFADLEKMDWYVEGIQADIPK